MSVSCCGWKVYSWILCGIVLSLDLYCFFFGWQLECYIYYFTVNNLFGRLNCCLFQFSEHIQIKPSLIAYVAYIYSCIEPTNNWNLHPQFFCWSFNAGSILITSFGDNHCLFNLKPTSVTTQTKRQSSISYNSFIVSKALYNSVSEHLVMALSLGAKSRS